MPNSGYFDKTFGQSGILTPVPDGVQSDGSVSYAQGFGPDYELVPGTSGALYPRAGSMNQLFNDVTAAIQQYQQNGIPPFITSAMNNGTPYSYAQYAMVLYGGVAYQSNVSGNTDTPPSSKWNVLSLSSPNQFTGGTTTGSANAQVLASTVPTSGLSLAVANQTLAFTPGFTNTGSATLAVTSPSIGATIIKKLSGGILVNLTGGEIVNGVTCYLSTNNTVPCWVIQAGPALGTMAPLNIGNNIANDTMGNAVGTVPPLALTGTNQTFALGQWGALIARSNSGTAMADTLPGTSGALPSGWYSNVQNADASASDVISVGSGGSIKMGNQTLTTLIMLPGETWEIQSQGSGNYEVIRTGASTLHSGPPQSTYKNLGAGWVSNTTWNITSDSIVVQDASGNTRRLTSVNQTINSAVSGAGGLDTGSMANNTWYYGYIIFNPATNTTSSLLSASYTAPTLPTGYSYASGAITCAKTDGSAHFIGGLQTDHNYQFQVGNNLASLPQLFSGAEGTYGSAWAAITVRGAGSFVPPVAGSVQGFLQPTNTTSNASAICTNSSYGNAGQATNPPPFQSIGSTFAGTYFNAVIETNSVQVQSQANSAGNVLGFTLNI